jgi:hypothetical protein
MVKVVNSISGPNLIIRRHPYEEPYHTELEVIATSGSFAGRRRGIYCTGEELAEIGSALQVFPRKVPDEYEYDYQGFQLRAYTAGRAGHTFLYIAIEADWDGLGRCQFSMPAEPVALNRLGELFVAFSKFEHLEFWWGQNVARLFAEHQPEQKCILQSE